VAATLLALLLLPQAVRVASAAAVRVILVFILGSLQLVDRRHSERDGRIVPCLGRDGLPIAGIALLRPPLTVVPHIRRAPECTGAPPSTGSKSRYFDFLSVVFDVLFSAALLIAAALFSASFLTAAASFLALFMMFAASLFDAAVTFSALFSALASMFAAALFS